MKRVLMIAEWYPPCQAWPTAAARAANLAQGLSAAGWQPVVLVPDRRGGVCGCHWCASGADFSVSVDLDVRRVPVSLSGARRTYHRVRAATGSGPGAPVAGAATDAAGQSVGAVAGWARRASREAEELAWLLGDTHTNWIGVCDQAAADIVSTERFDAVWTTSAPFGHSRIGRHLQRLGLPWVADLRDPASRDVVAPNRLVDVAVQAGRSRFRRPFRHADRVVAATEQVRLVDGHWLGRDPELILSGFDSEQWAAARHTARRSHDRFEIVFAGKIYENYRRPDVFLRGLRRVFDGRDAEQRRRLRFSYYGRDGALLLKLAQNAGVADVVVDHGFMAPAEMPAILAGAGALLLLTNDVGASGVPGGKFFELLAAHRPVLAVPGADLFVAEVLGATGAGLMADDAEDVAGIVSQWFGEWNEHGGPEFGGDGDRIEDYSAANAARKLGEVLDSVTTAAGTRGPAR